MHNFTSHSFSVNGLSGVHLEIRVALNNSTSSETHWIDNVEVSGTFSGLEAVNDTYYTCCELNNAVTVNVLSNDSDADGTIDATTVQIVGQTSPYVVAGQGTWTVNGSTGAITFIPQGGYTGDPTPIQYTVDDNEGNTSNQATVTIDFDNVAPTFTPPSDIIIYKDAFCNYNAAVIFTGDITDESDNCDSGLNATYTDIVANGTCEGEEIITRTWTLTDNSGNTTTYNQRITVEDNIPPTASNPTPITVECSADIPAAIISDVIDEADNCTANPVVAFVSDVSDNNSCPEIITRTYSVTDDCGNSITVSQQIIIDDNTPPIANALPDLVLMNVMHLFLHLISMM